jgi:predicted nucleic acid-binding protein
VLRRNAWQFATQPGCAETYDAEYQALTKLQAGAFVTLDKQLARRAAATRRPRRSTPCDGHGAYESTPAAEL